MVPRLNSQLYLLPLRQHVVDAVHESLLVVLVAHRDQGFIDLFWFDSGQIAGFQYDPPLRTRSLVQVLHKVLPALLRVQVILLVP